MKTTVTKLILCFTATFAPLSAQEAWLLEMPNKFSDYLVKRSIAGDYDKVAGIVEKIPDFIEKKQIRELELVKWKAEDGKINKKEKVTEGTRTFYTGARYYSMAGDKLDHRKITVTSPTTKRNFRIEIFGFIPRGWTPTFVNRGEKFTILLLERHAGGSSATVPIEHVRKLEYNAGSAKESVAWYSSDPLDGKDLSYYGMAQLAANLKIAYGTKIFSSVKKEGESLLRIEAHSSHPKVTESVTLHHNEAKFEGHSQTKGPLKRETIKVADQAYTKDGEDGSWSLTLSLEE